MTTTYNTGTISVSNGSTTVTGVGTNWIAGGILPGDDFRAAGLTVEIASVNSATSITLARAWPGAGQSSANYSIRLIDAGERSLVALNQIVGALGSGNLISLAGLPGATNKMPYFTGVGAMALADLTPAARALLARTAIEQSSPSDATAGRLLKVGAAGAALGADVYRRGNILGTVSQSGGVPTGAVIERGSNANGRYVRFADGTQVCTSTLTSDGAAETVWTYPAVFAGVDGLAITPTIGAPRFGNPTTIGVSNASLTFNNWTVGGIRSSVSTWLFALGRWS